MVKKDNKCWSCGKDTMEPFDEAGEGWRKCSNCGATDMPDPTHSAHIKMLEDTWLDERGESHYASRPVR